MREKVNGETAPARLMNLPTSVVASGRLASNLWLLGVLVVLMFLPSGRFHVLVPMLALTAAIGGLRLLVDLRRGRLDFLPVLILGFAAAATVPVGLGVLESNPGWRDVGIALVGGPVLWFAISYVADRWGVERLPSALAIGTVFVVTAMFMLLSGIGDSLILFVTPGAVSDREDGLIRVSFSGASSLIAAVPFLVTVGWDSSRQGVTLRNGPLVLGACAVGLMTMLLSGRQGLIGVVLLTPALIWLVGRVGFGHPGAPRSTNSRRGWMVLGLGVVCAAVMMILVGLKPLRVPRDLLAAVGVLESEGNARVGRSSAVRRLQARSLLDGWSERPFFGHGAGAVSDEFYTWRGFELGAEFEQIPRPWRAELSYHLLLFESGVIGVALYGVAVVVAWRQIRARFSALNSPTARMLVRASVVASIALAISTAANPLARAVGLQWSLMLPIIVLAGWSRTVGVRGLDQAT